MGTGINSVESGAARERQTERCGQPAGNIQKVHPGIVWRTELRCIFFDIGFNPARPFHRRELKVSGFLP